MMSSGHPIRYRVKSEVVVRTVHSVPCRNAGELKVQQAAESWRMRYTAKHAQAGTNNFPAKSTYQSPIVLEP